MRIFSSQRDFVTTIGIMLFMILLAEMAHADETIAWWRFDSANPWTDSSGHGYDLLSGAISVADDFDGAGTESQGSAYFDGTGWAYTSSTIDLTSCDAIRLSWWMKVDSTTVTIPIEQSEDAGINQGGILISTNEYEEGHGCAYTHGTVSGWHVESFPISQGEWAHYSVEYWPTAPNAADLVKFYKDGVLQEDKPVEAIAFLHDMGRTSDSFINDAFYFGARNTYSYFFEGNLDEIKLESFTPPYPVAEPQTLVPLTNIIAQWTFDDVNTPWADSSGKGNDLTNQGGVTQSSNTPIGTGYSAYFDNTETALLKTVETLNLSSYRHVQISWSQLVTSEEVDVLFEHSANSMTGEGLGGFYLTVNEAEPGTGCAATMSNDGIPNVPGYDHLYGTENTTWEEMVLDINLDATSDAMKITIYKNGTQVSTYFDYEHPNGAIPYGCGADTFINDYFNLGGRDAIGGVLNFSGYIDNFVITAEGNSTPPIPGDANNDGKVDGSDVTILAGNWQTLSGANWGMGDFNGDGKVDGSDVTILAGNWQSGVTTAVASVVPEPGTIALLLTAFLAIGLLARKSF